MINLEEYEHAGYSGKFDLYRKLENGKGVWVAHNIETGEVKPITYAQARGFEPIEDTPIKRLARELGALLLPRR